MMVVMSTLTKSRHLTQPHPVPYHRSASLSAQTSSRAAASTGFFHKSVGVRWVRICVQLKRWVVSWSWILRSGHKGLRWVWGSIWCLYVRRSGDLFVRICARVRLDVGIWMLQSCQRRWGTSGRRALEEPYQRSTRSTQLNWSVAFHSNSCFLCRTVEEVVRFCHCFMAFCVCD